MDIGTIKAGHHVIYGNNGICLVESITEMAFSAGDKKKTYFILRPLSNPNSVIYLPHDNELLISRLRAILTKQEIVDILSKPLADSASWIEDKKLRAASFRDQASSNHLPTLLSLIKCLCEKQDELIVQNKKMLSADREILNNALIAARNEISFVLDISQKDTEERLQAYLGIAL